VESAHHERDEQELEAKGSDRGDTEEQDPSFFEDPKRLIQTGLVVVVLIAAIYILLPKIIGLEDAIARLEDGEWQWIALGVLFNVGAFGAYVALFRGVIGEHAGDLDWRESYQITMAGLAATRLLSAGGAGGIVLTYWALRKAGMERSESARRMVAFLVLLYSVYLAAVIIFGVLLRAGVLPGGSQLSVTLIPAAIAGGTALLILLIALIPGDLQRRLERRTGDGRGARLAQKLATVPATLATGTRGAIEVLRAPRKGWVALGGAIGFWASNVAILWASFKAFGVSVPIGVVIQGFFVGMAANLLPAPAGVGAVDGGLIGAFVIFGFPASDVLAAVLIYRLIAFWLPVPPGIVAFFQLRQTVARWEQEGRPVHEHDTGKRVEGAGALAS